MKKVRTFLLMLAIFGLSVCATLAQTTYSIKWDGSDYNVYMGSSNVFSHSVMQNAIDFIKTDANGANCTIDLYHANGEDPLDLGGGSGRKITFEGNWGNITLTGKATYSSSSGTTGILTNGITVLDGIMLDSKAELTATGNRPMIYNTGTGILTISDGMVQSTGAMATGVIINYGTMQITGGIVKSAGIGGDAVSNHAWISVLGGEVQRIGSNGIAIYNYSNGTVSIGGGTVSATGATGIAISSRIDGEVHVYGTAIVTSENTSDTTPGTIYLGDESDNDYYRLFIESGTVKNTATGGHAVYNDSVGGVEVSGGTVIATENNGIAIQNNHSGEIVISGGTVSSSNYGNAIYNDYGTITVNGGNVSVLNGTGIYNNHGNIDVNGGVIASTYDNAIFNLEGNATFNGGVIFAYGTGIESVIDGSYDMSGNAVILAWNKFAGTTEYLAGTDDDIYKNPSSATAVWAKQGSNSGISVENGTNSGFIPIDDVTVSQILGNYTGVVNAVISALSINQNFNGITIELKRSGSNYSLVIAELDLGNGNILPEYELDNVTITPAGEGYELSKSGPLNIIIPVVEVPPILPLFPEGMTFNDVEVAITLINANIENGILTMEIKGIATLGSIFPITINVYFNGTNLGITNYEFGNSNLVVYPNPTNGQFSVVSSEMSVVSIEIYDAVGLLVHREPCTVNRVPCTMYREPFTVNRATVDIDISHLPAGIYFVKVGKEMVKVVKK